MPSPSGSIRLRYTAAMLRPSRRFLVSLFGIAVLIGPVPVQADVAQEAAEALLARAIHPQRDGSHLSKLFALRQLGDPSQRPLYEGLLEHPEWQVQVHAVLGLAEIAPDRRVDPELVLGTALPAHDAIVASAIDLDLIGSEEMESLLASDELSPAARMMIYAERTLHGSPPDVERLVRFTDHERLQVAALAAVLLKQRGRDDALAALEARLNEETAVRRDQMRLWLLESIRQYRLDRLLDWTQGIGWDDQQRRELIDAAVWTSLHLDTAASLDLWQHRIGRIDSRARQVKYILMLLASGEDIPANLADELPGNGELLTLLVAMVRAVATGTDRTAPMLRLIEIGHVRTNEWVLTAARDLPAPEAERVLVHLVASMERPGGMRPDRISLAIEGASRLFQLSPDRIDWMIDDAQDSEDLLYVLLLSLLDTQDPRAGEIARRIARPGFTRTDSLTLLLVAKHAEELNEAQRRQLGRIVAGGGRVSEMVRVQSAWLYLKHHDRIEATLARIRTP